MKYRHAALGGTFDHLHIGHEYIIDFALKNAEKVSIGLATAKLYKDKELAQAIEAYPFRKYAVEKYLESHHALSRCSLFRLNDIYGTTVTDDTLDAIVVTDETELNAHRINADRKKKGMKELVILKCPFVKGPAENIINSTDIRRGSINRVGFPYSSLFSADILYLPDILRKELQIPLTAPIYNKNEFSTAKTVVRTLRENRIMTIGVGDIVNKTVAYLDYVPDLQIIDYKTRRKQIENKSVNESAERYKNEPGTLYRSAVIQIHYKIQEFLQTKIKRTLIIDGEEDLLTLPAILLAPLKSIVFYGQYAQGIVMVRVTEEMKEKVADLVKQFTS